MRTPRLRPSSTKITTRFVRLRSSSTLGGVRLVQHRKPSLRCCEAAGRARGAPDRLDRFGSAAKSTEFKLLREVLAQRLARDAEEPGEVPFRPAGGDQDLDLLAVVAARLVGRSAHDGAP